MLRQDTTPELFHDRSASQYRTVDNTEMRLRTWHECPPREHLDGFRMTRNLSLRWRRVDHQDQWEVLMLMRKIGGQSFLWDLQDARRVRWLRGRE